MISNVFKIVSKVVTVAAVANTTYDLYKKGQIAYKTYKGGKKAKKVASKVVDYIKESIKDKSK